MDSSPRFGLIGSGSWATAIAKMLLTNTDELNWWVRREETKDHLLQYGRNPNYIQSIEFDTKRIHVSTDMQAVIDASDVLIFAIPSGYLDATIQEHKPQRVDDKVLINAIKGMVVEYHNSMLVTCTKSSGCRMSALGWLPDHATRRKWPRKNSATSRWRARPNHRTSSRRRHGHSLYQDPNERAFSARSSRQFSRTSTPLVRELPRAWVRRQLPERAHFQRFQGKRFLAAHEHDRDVERLLGDLLVTACSHQRTLGADDRQRYSVKGAIMGVYGGRRVQRLQWDFPFE